MKGFITSAVLAAVASTALAQTSCPNILKPAYAPPVVAAGWQAQLVVTGLRKPRSLYVDSEGALIALDAGAGIRRITFTDRGGTCLEVLENKLLVNKTALNHGLTFSDDGKTIYASTVQSVFAWAYDARAGTVGENPAIVIDGMSNDDHTTRTLLMSRKRPGTIIVSRGSDENFDVDALDISTGLSQIKAFDLKQTTKLPYDFNSGGRVLGWGLRNSVGIAEEPETGGIYSVENSIDDVVRNGIDIHENNPGEELNFHGLLSETAQGGNYGYPRCYAVWDTNIPNSDNLKVGSQFAMTQNSTINDTSCTNDYIEPRLTFPAHTAPLDILFANDGTVAYISFHGSFNKQNPVGYTLSTVKFSRGSPVEPATSNNALTNIMYNPSNTACPEGCFRPVGLAWDRLGRLFMTSDSTGEIYILMRQSGTPTSTAPGTIVTPTNPPNAASALWNMQTLIVGAAAVLAASLMAF